MPLKVHYIISNAGTLVREFRAKTVRMQPFVRVVTSRGCVNLSSERLPALVKLPSVAYGIQMYSGGEILPAAADVIERDASVMHQLETDNWMYTPDMIGPCVRSEKLTEYCFDFTAAAQFHFLLFSILHLQDEQIDIVAAEVMALMSKYFILCLPYEDPVGRQDLTTLPHLTALVQGKEGSSAMHVALIFEDRSSAKFIWEKDGNEAPKLTPLSLWRNYESDYPVLGKVPAHNIIYFMNSRYYPK